MRPGGFSGWSQHQSAQIALRGAALMSEVVPLCREVYRVTAEFVFGVFLSSYEPHSFSRRCPFFFFSFKDQRSPIITWRFDICSKQSCLSLEPPSGAGASASGAARDSLKVAARRTGGCFLPRRFANKEEPFPFSQQSQPRWRGAKKRKKKKKNFAF